MGNLENNNENNEYYPENQFGRLSNSYRYRKNNSYITKNFKQKKNPYKSNKNYYNSKNDFWKTMQSKDRSEKFNKPYYQLKNRSKYEYDHKYKNADYIGDNDLDDTCFKKNYNKYKNNKNNKNNIKRFYHEENKNLEFYEIEEELVDLNENKENIPEEDNKIKSQDLSSERNEIIIDEKPIKKERKISEFSIKSISTHSKTNSTEDSLSANLKENNEIENKIIFYNQFNVNNILMGNVNNMIINPFLENTEILRVNVKISKNKSVVFRLRRFDDLFETIKLFCEIHFIDEKLIRPIIMKTISSLNLIYRVMNSNVNAKNVAILKEVKKRNKI